MADKKISQLDAITGANTASDDAFVVVDTSTGVTKKITREELNNAIEQDVLSTVDINGGTIDGTTIGGTTAAAGSFTTVDATGDISLGDNNKAIFGAGTDFEIYHDGSNSWIHDKGTGNLNIEGRNVFIIGANNDTILAGFIDGAESRLYYNGSQKLATTSTGVDVTGALTVSGDFTVNGTTTTINSTTLEVDDKNIVLASGAADAAAANGSGITIDGASATFTYVASGDKWQLNKPLDVGGDVTFGDNEKAVFGAGSDLEIRHDSNNSKISHTGTGGLYVGADTFALQNGTHDENFIVMADNGAVTLYHDNSAKLATTSTGINVTGTVTADGLTVETIAQDVSQNGGVLFGANAQYGMQLKQYTTSGGVPYAGIVAPDDNNGWLQFEAGGSQVEAMRINSDADVLLGNTVVNPASGFNNQSGFGYDKSAGKVEIASTSGLALSLGRNQSSDGHIAEFRKESTAVGDIQTHGGKLQIGQGNANVQFSNADDAIIPTNGNGTVNDNALDLGTSSARFNDIHYGGAIITDDLRISSNGTTASFTLTHPCNMSIGKSGGDNFLTVMSGTAGGCGINLNSSTTSGFQRINAQNTSYPLELQFGGTTKISIDNSEIDINEDVKIDNGQTSTVTILSDDNGESVLNLYGSSQGTGRVYVGQSASYGGGIEYNGDNSPASTGAGADYITLFRRTAGTTSWTARNLHSNNDWGFRGNVTAYASDERLKENIETIPNALDMVCKLRGVTFDWKDDCEDKGFMPTMKHETGVIAQEVQAVIPDAAVPAPFDEEYLTVKHEKIIPVLIEAIKELKAEIEELKNASAE